ncbi:MAG: preprotein translocase subunit SecE [Candidatus Tyrphobacter sp.]
MGDQKKSAMGRNLATANRRAAALGGADFFRGVIAELRRVTWPTREEWISATVLTISLVIGIGVFTWALDYVFGLFFGWIHPASGGVL